MRMALMSPLREPRPWPPPRAATICARTLSAILAAV